QYAGSVPLRDKTVVEGRSSMAQGQQRLGVAILLQEDIVDRRNAILQVTQRIDIRADALSDLADGQHLLDDRLQLHRNDLVDHGIDEPDSPAESIEDRRLAHICDCGDLLEGRREPPLPEHLDRRTSYPVDIPASIRAKRLHTTWIR